MQISLVMMALGLFRFGVNNAAYQELTRTETYRWAQLPRIGREPASQFLGSGGQKMTLNGVIYPSFKGGLRQVELMRFAAELGEPLMLVDGLGWVLDRWTITSIDEGKTFFMADGAPRKITFKMRLQSYGGDRA